MGSSSTTGAASIGVRTGPRDTARLMTVTRAAVLAAAMSRSFLRRRRRALRAVAGEGCRAARGDAGESSMQRELAPGRISPDGP
ncbi:hypothetical protein GCM10009771_09530 [Nesterenkonia flava]